MKKIIKKQTIFASLTMSLPIEMPRGLMVPTMTMMTMMMTLTKIQNQHRQLSHHHHPLQKNLRYQVRLLTECGVIVVNA
jgi:hypothetical protein